MVQWQPSATLIKVVLVLVLVKRNTDCPAAVKVANQFKVRPKGTLQVDDKIIYRLTGNLIAVA